jgi:S1-C subfamily serine protease
MDVNHMHSPWNNFVRTAALSMVLGFGAGVIGTALTSNYLADYALSLGELASPARLSDELPRALPATYADALREVTDSVLPGVARVYAPGSYASPFGAGAVLTSDGWIVTMAPDYTPNLLGYSAVVDGKAYPVEQAVADESTPAVFLKVNASNLPVFAFGSGFGLAPGDQVFVPSSPSSLFVESVFESRWPSGAASSDVPARRVVVADPLLGAYPGAPVVNARGELVGLVERGGGGFSSVLPIDGVLPVFNATLRSGTATRAALGVSSVDLSRAFGRSRDETLGLAQGALLSGVTSVRKGSAAERAGLAPGDVIVSVDGTPVDAHRSLDELVVVRNPGDVLVLRVVSKSGEREVKVTLETL